MSNIGIERPIKQVGQNSWRMFWIFMNLKWFMEVRNNNKQCLLFFYCISSKVCYDLIWWFLSVYKVQDQTKAQFVANAVQVEM